MTVRRFIGALAAVALLVPVGPAHAQEPLPSDDPVIEAIWNLGMGDQSMVADMAQVLLDSIGPRLYGSQGERNAQDWAMRTIESWGVQAEREEYGTWEGWTRGITHIDLIEPRIRTLNGTMLAWSAGTDGPIEAPVVAMPHFDNADDFQRWLPTVEGKFVAFSYAEPTCRAPESWEQHATPESWERMQQLQQDTRRRWFQSTQVAGKFEKKIKEILGS